MKKSGNAEHLLGTKFEDAESQLGTWHSRGYLPHYENSEKLQSITFRLVDSLPKSKLAILEEELLHLPEKERLVERRKWIEKWLDAGKGCCALRHPKVARIMQESLLHFDGERYRLLAWCIMPNHVHVLIQPSCNLGKIVQSWKSYTGRWALAHYAELELGVPGKSFWMREYWDRFIRNKKHFEAIVEYIHENPVKAGLCKSANDWKWSSAGFLLRQKEDRR